MDIYKFSEAKNICQEIRLPTGEAVSVLRPTPTRNENDFWALKQKIIKGD
jgi:hypothetical protein